MLRGIAGAVAGVLVLFALVSLVEVFSNAVHPFPADFIGTHDEICEVVKNYPAWVLAVAIPMWAFSAFAATWTARKLGNAYAALVVGLLTLAGLILNLAMLPYPIWFKVGCLIAIPAAAWAGGRKSSRESGVVSAGAKH